MNTPMISEERLIKAGDDVTAELRRQQQILLVRQIVVMIPINLVISLLVVGFMVPLVPLVNLLVWLAVMVVSTGYLWVNALRLNRRPPPDRVTGETLRRAEFWAAALGLLWGSVIILFYMVETVRYQMFLAFVLMALASGCVNMLQPLPRICFWFAATILAPMVIWFVAFGGPIQMTVALLSIIFFGALMNSSQHTYRQAVRVIESSMQLEQARSSLVDAIESVNDAFAIYDRDGNIRLANERFRSWFGDCRNLAEVPGTAGMSRLPDGTWLHGSVSRMSDGEHVSVHTDVTDLKKRQHELVLAKRQAEEASRTKSEFLANMSHELRTPLNAIMGFSEMMRKGMFGPLGSEKYKQYAVDIHDSAAHLLSIISDILNLSKIEASRYAVRFEDVDVRELAQAAVGVCVRRMGGVETRNVEIRIEPGFGLIRADPRALKQVLLNLVDNAMKFTPPSGIIKLHAFIDRSGRPCIEISDTGIGIPADKLETIRQPFQQVESAFQRKFRGTGLGLSISEALVQMHEGELKIESEFGTGTRVLIILPAKLRVIDRDTARVG